MRKNFEMSAEDLEALLNACQSVPLIALQCGPPISQQEQANIAWAGLGKKMGFKSMTVQPSDKGDKFFSAEVESPEAECQGIEIESGVFSGCDQSAGDCPTCGK